MTAPLIDVRAAGKTYPGNPPVHALHPTDLAVSAGESVAIIGPSGSGKSTLLSIMGTLDRPSSGDVVIAGCATGGMRESHLATLRAGRLGFVFQQFHLQAGLTARENVAEGLLYSGVPRSARIRRAVDALDRVGMSHRAGHRPAELSGGERQRVAIARAIVGEPAVLFADEPTGALDSRTGEAIVQLLLEQVTPDRALVLVTHDLSIASRMDRQVRVLDGTVTCGEVAHA